MPKPKIGPGFGEGAPVPAGVSRREQLGKCKECESFRRLPELVGEVCVNKKACKEDKAKLIPLPESTSLVECAECGEFVEPGELDEIGWCVECQPSKEGDYETDVD